MCSMLDVTSHLQVLNVTSHLQVLNVTSHLQVLPVVIYFSTIISMLYYLGVMQWVVQKIGFLLQTLLGTTAGESLNAAGNIFIGQV